MWNVGANYPYQVSSHQFIWMHNLNDVSYRVAMVSPWKHDVRDIYKHSEQDKLTNNRSYRTWFLYLQNDPCSEKISNKCPQSYILIGD